MLLNAVQKVTNFDFPQSHLPTNIYERYNVKLAEPTSITGEYK